MSSTPSGVSRKELADIFALRRSKGAMVGIREVNAKQFAVEFATPDTTGTQYRYETFLIGKKELDAKLRSEIEHVAIGVATPGT